VAAGNVVTVEGAENVILTIDPSSTYLFGAPAAATLTMAHDTAP
jgi:hypothetical protein